MVKEIQAMPHRIVIRQLPRSHSNTKEVSKHFRL